jgi:Ca2+-binding EF-hand superfamily protein
VTFHNLLLLNTLELSEASPKFLIIRENPGPQEESGACLIVVEENLNISKSKFFKEIQMTNKLMIAMMMAVISWIGNEAAAQQTDAADGPNLDQQIKEPQEKGLDNPAAKQRGKRGKRGQGRRGGPEMLKEVFSRMDKDGDGTITIDELPERLREKMPKLDANADGGCDISEFQTAMQNRRDKGRGNRAGKGKPGAEESGARKRGGKGSLDRLDKDGDGKISKAEAPERMQQRFEMIDTNGDGSIDKMEQEALLKKRSDRGGKGGRRGDGGPNKQGQKPKRPDTDA